MSDKTNKKPSRPIVPIAKQAAPAVKHIGGLGKGLDALISRGASASGVTDAPPPPPPFSPAPQAPSRGSVLTVPLAKIKASPWQPRHGFDDAALKELADSIKAHGVIQPLVCRVVEAGEYELIGGERRLRAASLAGLSAVPIIVLEAADRDAAELALVENLQREDLNALEEAEAYNTLADAFGLTQEEIAERVGKARASVANAMRLLALPDEVKQMLGSGAISAAHAKLILSAENDGERIRLASEVVKDGLTVRALEQKIARAKSAPPIAKTAMPDIPPEHQALLLDKLTQHFGTSVHLSPSVRYNNGKRGRGKIEIDFVNNSDLDRLLDLLGVDVNEL